MRDLRSWWNNPWSDASQQPRLCNSSARHLRLCVDSASLNVASPPENMVVTHVTSAAGALGSWPVRLKGVERGKDPHRPQGAGVVTTTVIDQAVQARLIASTPE